jgi:hypothetical protein
LLISLDSAELILNVTEQIRGQAQMIVKKFLRPSLNGEKYSSREQKMIYLVNEETIKTPP